MVTLTVQLDDRTYRQLQSRAERARLSVESYASSLLETEAVSEELSPELAAMVDRHMERYRPVFDRLAQ